jgi:tetratricopeptide (TPR) repeat protein
MFKVRCLIAACLLISLSAQCQNFKETFASLLAKNDTLAALNLLHKWDAQSQKDPELFIAWFNYYAHKSMFEVVELRSGEPSGQNLTITDPKSDRIVGYMGSSRRYDPQILQMGYDKIDKGISLYPSRLDMRFGKAYMLGEQGNFPDFTDEIVNTIEYGHKINNKWLWQHGDSLKDARQFLLNSLQDYVNTIYKQNDDSLLSYMRQIAGTVLKYYPDHVESLSNMAVTYLIVGEADKALPYLLKAEKIAPTDIIVLGNIAEAYKRKKDKANAKVYYEKIIKYGNADDIQGAQEQIKLLE